jgi:hypothetical protein
VAPVAFGTVITKVVAVIEETYAPGVKDTPAVAAAAFAGVIITDLGAEV